MSCMQRWNYRYNQNLQPMGAFSIALVVGSAFHDAMEQFYATKGKRVNVATLQFPEGLIPSMKNELDLDYWNHVLPRMIEAYCIYYRDDHLRFTVEKIEEEVTIDYMGFTLRAKIDLVINEQGVGRFITDHKTSGRLNRDVVAGWDFRFQFMFYLWVKWKQGTEDKLKGYYINAIKKPELRVKKSESVPEFAQRVFEDMIAEPDKYFYRERYIITRDAMQHFEDEVVNPRLGVLQYIIDNPESKLSAQLLNLKNTEECQKWGAPCAFMNLCRHGDDFLFEFEKKERKHLELEEAVEV